MGTWALAAAAAVPSVFGLSGTTQYRSLQPQAYIQQGPVLYMNPLLKVRPGRNYLFSQYHCNPSMLRGGMVSREGGGLMALEGRPSYGGLHKQLLGITHRRAMHNFCRVEDRRHVTLCFKNGDRHDRPAENSVSCTTFNILAPIYKRINGEDSRESQFRDYWVSRNESILDMLLLERSSVICLQEFWVRNEELVEMYEQKFHDAGYEIYKLGRTNNRGDGLFTAVRKDHFKVVNQRELLFHDFGDRVAQLLHLRSVIPSLQSEMGGVPFEALVVNTHLLFPHNSNYCLIRLRQVYKILEYLEAFKADYNLPPIPVILCGDWNGSKRGQVYKFLRSQGFVSSYDAAHNYSDNDKDAHKWISHRNHRGNICGVDFIWLLNPNKHRKLLRTSWMEAVFGIVKSKLKEAGLNDLDAFCFFKSAKRFEDYVTLKDFGQGLQQLGLTEQFSEGLTTEEIEDLMVAADLDGNGIIDSREFQKLMVAQSIDRSLEGKNVAEVKLSAPYFPGNSERPLKQCQNGSTTVEPNKHSLLMQTIGSESGTPLMKFDADSNMQDPCCLQETEIGFDVKRASLFPSEVEQGIWPENYLMSDHALLSAVFSPVKIPKSQKANL
uniref:EF-hand domain-containing protein n=1 Tax=Picea sitchensis TaxID=3332 RepID=B8LK58_PICSI|nr:unknown [Picea sitchensis]